MRKRCSLPERSPFSTFFMRSAWPSADGSHAFPVESVMPLYTLVISHRGRTAIAQQRRSNWRGFYQAVIEKFPDLAPAATTMMRTAPEAVPNLVRTWRADVRIDGEDLIVHIVETRG